MKTLKIKIAIKLWIAHFFYAWSENAYFLANVVMESTHWDIERLHKQRKDSASADKVKEK